MRMLGNYMNDVKYVFVSVEKMKCNECCWKLVCSIYKNSQVNIASKCPSFESMYNSNLPDWLAKKLMA